MASGGGPKPRKSKSAKTRAWRSLGKSVRQEYKRRGKAMGKTHAETVAAFGGATRKARIKRGTNPNTGTGSYAKHAVKRAAAKGKISKKDAKRTIRSLGKPGGLSKTFAHEVLRPGTSGTSNYGARIAGYEASRRPTPAPAPTTTTSSSKPRSNYKRKVDKVAAKVTSRAAASGKYGAPRSQKSARKQARKIIKGRK